jgi:hypothetical protein
MRQINLGPSRIAARKFGSEKASSSWYGGLHSKWLAGRAGTVTVVLTIMHFEVITVAAQQYRLATWPRRIVARIMDLLLVVEIWITAGTWFLPVGVAISVVLSGVYLLIGNGLLRGRSIGKRLAGLKIIDARHGGPCTVLQDFIRHRYLLFSNPVFLLLTAYDASKGLLEKPELYVVMAEPLTSTETEERKEKPAKLNLAGLRETYQKLGPDDESAKGG